MPTLFDEKQRSHQVDRIKKLKPFMQPSWGKLTAGNLLPHLTDPIRTAIGEYEVAPVKSFFSSRFGSWLLIYGIKKWPQSPPTNPKYSIDKEGRAGTDFEKDKAELIDTIERFAAMSPGTKFNTHPVFGDISYETWGYLMDKHIEHHCRQFRL